jgi:CMP-N,N'-diacetyllegionaminic acid synthase
MRTLGGKTLVRLAVECAMDAECEPVVSTDIPELLQWPPPDDLLARPRALAQDDTPMFDVVAHAVKELGLNDSDIVVLLQPTAPFRTPAHIRQALALLRESGADSVVSLVQVPLTHHPDAVVEIMDGRARPFRWWCECGSEDWATLRTRRQDYEPTYIRDGTVYAFPVKTLRSGTIYGHDVRPLIIPPDESCELDTEADWADVERRWRERHG